MIFQAIDDKTECIGIYTDGQLYYNDFPHQLQQTWKYTGSLEKANIEYAWIFCEGLSLADACPPQYKDKLLSAQKRLGAYIHSFKLAKIDLRDHCIFELVPEDFLKQFCEIKNQITQHVFENYSKPDCYEHLRDVQKLLHKISYQNLNLNNEGCKHLHMSSRGSVRVKHLLNGPHQFITVNRKG